MQLLPNTAIKHLDYVDRIGAGQIVSRRHMAQVMEVAYSTAQYHLDKAVEVGALVKVVAAIGNQTGWGYCLPETQRRLIEDGAL